MNKKLILNTEFVKDELISNLTTIKTNGAICGAFYPINENQLKNVYTFLKEYKLPFIVIGNGSNMLISDKAKIYALSLKRLRQQMKINKESLYVSASVPLPKIFQYTYKHNLSGFEELAGIPASLGGALKNNASAFGNSIFKHLEYITIFKNGKVVNLKKENIDYSYHKTALSDCIILSAKFNLTKKKHYQIKNQFSNCMIKRNIAQPKGLSCGSVFQNPPFQFAGKLIEECNLKGFKFGEAEISSVHANFIINKSHASFSDIKFLINLCQQKVKEKFDVDLKCEVEIIE